MPKIRSIKINSNCINPMAGCSIQDIPESSRLVILLGPNGCGKSSILAALQLADSIARGRAGTQTTIPVEVETFGPPAPLNLYLRTAYRTEHDFGFDQGSAVRAMHAMDEERVPPRATGPDSRVSNNYAQILRSALQRGAMERDSTFSLVAQRLLAPVRDQLRQMFPGLDCLDISDSVARNQGRSAAAGTFYFSRDGGSEYSFAGLSAGEREVFDLLLDLHLWASRHDSPVFCIDC